MFNFMFSNNLVFFMLLIFGVILFSERCRAGNEKISGRKSLSKAELLRKHAKTANTLKNNPILVVAPETKLGKSYASYDFGEVKEGSRPKHVFEFKNTTQKNMKVLNSRVPCGCASIQIQNKELKPGDPTKFTVTLDTRKHQGPITKSFYLLTDNKDKPIIKYEMKAFIKAKPAPICHVANQIEVPALKPGETKKVTLPIENRGLKDLVVQYRFPSKAIKVLTKSPFIVPTGQTRDFIFQFTAGDKPQEIKDNLVLITNDRRKNLFHVIITGLVQE